MITPDTEVTLLLCARLQKKSTGTKPLTPGEWNNLAEVLYNKGLRPQSLVDKIPSEIPLDAGRLQELLGRGAALSLAIERWNQAGIWILSRSDRGYPSLWRKRLKKSAPPILYGVGNLDRLRLGGLGVVGSRDASDDDLRFAHKLGAQCAAQSVVVVSGGARGVDEQAMMGGLNNGGDSIGVLSHDLMRASTNKKWRSHIRENRLTLVSAASPSSGFNPGLAMARNKLIYSLSHAAVVIATGLENGGTWTGALENLKARWAPLYARRNAGQGCAALLSKGARELPSSVLAPDFQIVSLAGIYDVGDSLLIRFFELLREQMRGKALTLGELIQIFQLHPEQLQIWLEKGTSEGLLVQNSDGKFALLEDMTKECGQLEFSLDME